LRAFSRERSVAESSDLKNLTPLEIQGGFYCKPIPPLLPKVGATAMEFLRKILIA